MALTRKKKIVVGSIASVVLLSIVVISIFAGRKDAPEVTTVHIKRQSELRQVVKASGEVRPVQFINLTSEVAGRIEELYVSPGDLVSKGQPLVRLDPTQLQSSQEAQMAAVQAALSDVQTTRTQVLAAENQVAQSQQTLQATEAALAAARQQVITSETNVDRAKVDLNTSRRELTRATELLEAGVVSRAEYDSARDRFDQAQVALRTAQAQLEQSKINVQEAQVRVGQQKIAVKDSQTGVLRARAGVKSSEARANQQQALLRGQSSQRSKATQYSPLSGVVADIPSKVGQFAVAGLSTTPLMTIADMSTIHVKVNVDETEISRVAVGQLAKIEVDALPDKHLEGVVTQKNPLAVGKSDLQGGISNRVNIQEAKEFEVLVEIQNLSQEVRDALRPGMTAQATITTAVKNNVMSVPIQSLVEKLPDNSTPSATRDRSKEIKGIYILENSKVKFVAVQTGITGETDIEITSGLNSGVEVVTGPSRVLRTLKDGSSVKRQKRKPGANPDEKEDS
jgi:HlyD family secretion protein